MNQSDYQSCRFMCILALILACGSVFVVAQEPKTTPAPKDTDVLAADQGGVADKYTRLEKLMFRMAEYDTAQNPRRAALLHKAIQMSKEKHIRLQMETLVGLLNKDELSRAFDNQKEVRADLETLLELLSSEDRADHIKDQRKRYMSYIKEIERILRQQRDVQGRTEGGVDAQRLAEAQENIAERTAKLDNRIGEDEGTDESAGDGSQDDKDPTGAKDGTENGDAQDRESNDNSSDGDGKDGDGKDGDSKDGKSNSGNKDSDNKDSDNKDSDNKDSDNKDSNQDSDSKDGKAKDGESQDGESKEGKSKDGDGKQSDGKSGEGSESKDGQSKDKKGKEDSAESKDKQDDAKKSRDSKDKDSDNKDSQSGESKSGDSKSGEQQSGQSKDVQSKDGQSQDGKSQQGQQGQQGQDQQQLQQDQQAQEEQPARKRLQAAEEKMREAQRRLEEARRDDAAETQEQARRELEAAKAELEEILRQLREEEIERTLALLESRFRRMLEMQIKVYESTMRLDKIPLARRDRHVDLEATKLSFQERRIVMEADKALALLQEEGSSVAFPESVEQMRDDMEQVVERLSQARIGRITQGLEEDIIESLDEMVEAMKQAQLEQQQQQQEQQQQQQQAGEQEKPLVDQIAELKMLKALQLRINKRTKRYSNLLEDVDDEAGQATDDELVAALQRLADREARLQLITRDLVLGRNQ